MGGGGEAEVAADLAEVVKQFRTLVQWVEQGVAPSVIVATKYKGQTAAEGIAFTRPLCPYPKVARYTGTGSPDDAANFACATATH